MKNLITNTIKLKSMETFKFSVVKGSVKASMSVTEISYNLALNEAKRKAERLGYSVVNSLVPVLV
jgi:hypothetical protein